MGLYQVDPTLKPLIDALIERRKGLGLSQLDVDRLSGWAAGGCSKYEVGMRTPGMVSLSIWAQALGCKWVVHTDNVPEATWKSSKDIFGILEKHRCTLNLAESGVQSRVRTYAIKEARAKLQKAAAELESAAITIAQHHLNDQCDDIS